MQVTITLTGETPLLCHNARLSDPDDEITKQIKLITSKKKKTEDDRRAIERLEWEGGLYLSENTEGPMLPTANIRKCLIEAGKTRKLGKQIGRALNFLEMETPLIYDGPRNIDKLYSRPSFRHRASVRNQMNRVVRMRPKFPAWSVTAKAFLLEDMLDPSDLSEILTLAGLIEGLGDNRTNAFGRFTGEVVRG